MIFSPRRACASVTVVVLCVCLSVYPSVPASASVETSKQRYSGVSLIRGVFEKKPSLKGYGVKKQYANELELTVNRFRTLSGPTTTT